MNNVSSAISRCRWCEGDALYTQYHDEEWGVPVTDEQQLFGLLCLEGAQAGLSWITVLRRREHYLAAFHQFDIDKVAAMTEADVEQILQTHHVIKHRGKLNSVITNARAVKAMAAEGISFSEFLWAFAPTRLPTKRLRYDDIPTSTEASKAMSKALKKHGFRFVGETICYAFMQAVGMVNDHVDSCYRREMLRISPKG